ncbi:hypothetical protein D3C78_19510 [compost metagenome]
MKLFNVPGQPLSDITHEWSLRRSEIICHDEQCLIIHYYSTSYSYSFASNGVCVNHKLEQYHFFLENDQIDLKLDMLPVPDDWWGKKIQKPLDFIQHPGNVEIHDQLGCFEPLYKSDNVWLLANKTMLINHPTLGWISNKYVRRKDIPVSINEEIRMVKNLI